MSKTDQKIEKRFRDAFMWVMSCATDREICALEHFIGIGDSEKTKELLSLLGRKYQR